MKAYEKYQAVFGSIESLSDQIPWTTGVSNLVEYLLWETRAILGISKTELIRKIVQWLDEECDPTLTVDQRINFIKKKLTGLIAQTDNCQPYDKPRAVYCGPREALRRNRYFSEDYLNKEFDIFLGLSSDEYLDFLYRGYLEFPSGGRWATHGNGGIFENSTRIGKMSMDNLAYNHDRRVLVANELKLGGKKNKDQLIKYSYLRLRLEEIGFIAPDTKYLLLFIGDRHERFELSSEIDKEVEYCRTVKGAHLLEGGVEENARNMQVESMTWLELVSLNKEYARRLDPKRQVEEKLLSGFAATLLDKASLQ